MKKIFLLLIVMVTMSGCASIIQGMGGATAEELNAVKAEVTELRKLLAEYESIRGDMILVKTTLTSIQGNLDNLPRETIRKMIEILQRSVNEPAPAPRQPSTSPGTTP